MWFYPGSVKLCDLCVLCGEKIKNMEKTEKMQKRIMGKGEIIFHIL
jgi:hypothetical protein